VTERTEMKQEKQEMLDSLFDLKRSQQLRDRWHTLQAKFVDDPRDTVAEADTLVSEVLEELEAAFSGARADLERQWSRGDDVSTEDLRRSLQRYRAFFDRLLSV
jgi:hypothetical protein